MTLDSVTKPTGMMSCPRRCGTDVREHNSSDRLRFGYCDTDAGRAADQNDQIRAWLISHKLFSAETLTAEDIIDARDADWDEAIRSAYSRALRTVEVEWPVTRTDL